MAESPFRNRFAVIHLFFLAHCGWSSTGRMTLEIQLFRSAKMRILPKFFCSST
jgi:hypothetical protein